MLKNLLVLLHIITAAGWFGLALSFGSLARRAAAEAGSALVDEGTKSVKLMNIFAVLTFVFGLLAFLLGGGFAVYGPNFHTSLLLILILVVVQYAMIGAGWRRIAERTGDGRPDAARKRVSAGIGIGHLIWLVVLILMLWTRFPLA